MEFRLGDRGGWAGGLWGVGLLAFAPLSTVFAVGLANVACSSGAASSATPIAASSAPAVLSPGPPSPSGGLLMPTLALDWRPPSSAAGDVAALAEAIAMHPRVGLLVDRSVESQVGELDTMRLAALVGRLAPNTAVRPIAGAGQPGPQLADVLREDPPLVPVLGDSGRTRWSLPSELKFDDARLQGWAELGDPAILMLGAVGIDSPVWRELATGSVGSCAPLFDALLEGQERSLVELEPFLDHADALLEQVYLEQLRAVAPDLAGELAEFEPERQRTDFDGPGWERYQCGRSYLEYFEPFAACADAASDQVCASTPRLFLQGAARIGSVEPSVYVRDDCPRRLERDYVEELRGPARTAAELVAEALDVRWMVLANRLATLSDVHAALEQLCRPARRRFAETDLDSLRAQVGDLEQLFTRNEEPAHDARFLANDGSFHVPGVGRVRQLAHYDGGSGSASRALSAAAASLTRFERAHGRCLARPGEPPVMAMLVGAGDADPEFLGFFYSEELWCDELGPL